MTSVDQNASRVIAIGDIHGCDHALELLLDEIQPAKNDTIIVLGDIVDRGPNSARVVEMLMQLSDHANLKLIMGNHEEMMLSAINAGDRSGMWMAHGGKETLASYGGRADEIPPWHLTFLSEALDYCETDTHIFVHGKLEPDLPLTDQTPDWLRWAKLLGFEPPWHDGRTVVCGHTSQSSGVPLVLPGWICIDTNAYGGGMLTALDISTNEFIQTSQEGEVLRELYVGDLR